MLSNEYTLAEVKSELLGYADYGYSDLSSFDAELTSQLEKVYYDIMIKFIPDIYSDIQDKSTSASDRVDFLDTIDVYERNLYFAEVHFARAYFLRLLDNKESQDNIGNITSYRVEGFSESGESSGSGSGIGGKKSSAKKFYEKGRNLMIESGYDMRYRVIRG